MICFFSSRRRHTRCALVTGVQTCALPICTGYAPIVRAAQRAYDHDPRDDAFTAGEAATVKALAALQDGDTVEAGDGARRFLAPASLAALAELYATHPEATLTAGSTDVGLWVTKNFQRPATVIHQGRVPALKAIEETPEAITIRSGVTRSEEHTS